jgi:CheY-like chemotaxis protein
MLLAERTLLVVDDDHDSLDVLTAHLVGQGARVHGVRSGTAALEVVRNMRPDALITELVLPDFDGRSLLSALRDAPLCGTVPALALTSQPALVGYARALGAGFEKFLLKPTRLGDVTDALCCLLRESRVPPSGVVPSLGEISEAIALHDYRALLGALNASTTHRHTGLFRFDGGELTSIWTFDRERPAMDPFPLRQRTDETPCELVRSTRGTIVLEDALRDERTLGRFVTPGMRSLCGVPLGGDNGTLYGMLGHFDPEPHPALPHAVDLLERVARMFRFLSAKSLRRTRTAP